MMNIHSEPPGIPNNKIAANTFETIIVIDLKNKYNSNIRYLSRFNQKLCCKHVNLKFYFMILRLLVLVYILNAGGILKCGSQRQHAMAG